MTDDVREARFAGIGGSDARVIMSGDQRAIERLWLEKRRELDPEDYSDNLVVQLGNITEEFNTDWFEMQTGLVVTDEQTRPIYSEWEIAMSTLDGKVRKTPDGEVLGVFEAKFMLPFNWSEDKAIEKYFAQVQHNMMVTGLERSFLSVITGGGAWVCPEIEADIFYQIRLLEAEKDFWDCVQTGRTPGVPVVEVPLAERVRVLDMTGSNEWAEQAGILVETKKSAERHDKAKKAIKKLFPPDAAQARGYGVTVKLSKDGKTLIDIDKTAIAEAAERLAA